MDPQLKDIIIAIRDRYQGLSSRAKTGIMAVALLGLGTAGTVVGYNTGADAGYLNGAIDMEMFMVKHVPGVKEHLDSTWKIPIPYVFEDADNPLYTGREGRKTEYSP